MDEFSKSLSLFSCAVVTGGSSGIGESLLRLMGTVESFRVVCNLSRREPNDSLDGRLRHHPCDLADAGALAAAAEAVRRDVASAPPGKLLVILNSGFGAYGRFPDIDGGKQTRLLDVNVRSVVDLTARLMGPLREREGAVLLVASTAAWQPTPWLATYGASKAFVLQWGLALREDLRGAGIGVTVLCPGPTRTDFFSAAQMGDAPPGVGMADAGAVARLGLRGVARNRAVVVPGVLNKVSSALACRLPRRWQGPVADFILKRFRNPSSNV
ncbi:MAG: SDR family NAD(P)-dependent oxidoreductase [Opitutales bacterium]|nr:SDR family NAD(P)-dependent oxidoreductase [Opitutales bacterium]